MKNPVLTPHTINLHNSNISEQLEKLGADPSHIAAIGLHTKTTNAQVTVLPQEMIEEARSVGSSKAQVKFNKDYKYLGQSNVSDDIAVISGEEGLENTPTFGEIAYELSKRYGSDVRMVRRSGPTKLFASQVGQRGYKVIDYGRTQLACQFVDDELVTTTGFSAMQHIAVKGIRQMLKGEQTDNVAWREFQTTPDFARTISTMGRMTRRINILGLKDGRISGVELTKASGQFQPKYYDAIGDTKIDGTVIGLLPGHNDLVVSIKTDGDSAWISLTKVNELSNNVQQMVLGNPIG